MRLNTGRVGLTTRVHTCSFVEGLDVLRDAIRRQVLHNDICVPLHHCVVKVKRKQNLGLHLKHVRTKW